MSADESEPRWPHGRRDAEVSHVVATLRKHGVLTRARLAHLCGAEHWSEPAFAQALALAVSSGRVKSLGEDFYEALDP